MRPILALIVASAALLTPFASSSALAQSQPEPTAEDRIQNRLDVQRAHANRGASPDRLVVVYDGPSGESEAHPDRQHVRQQLGGRVLRADTELGRDVVRVQAGDAEVAARRIRQLPGVLDAYPDPVASATMAFNDARGPEQWGLYRTQVHTAWDASVGQGVRVAILDCGVRSSHPDLAGRVVAQANFTGSATTDDRCNHGTHVAGTVAATTDNAVGVAGIARGANLINVKVLGDDGLGFFSWIDEGIKWAANNGARVVNLSLNADIPCPTGTQAAVNYAWHKGVVVIASAGNSGLGSAGAPANCNNVIGVGASDAVDGRPSWSNHGTAVDIAAPGVDILSTVNPELHGGAAYARMSGTSMAAPHVAGVAALLFKTQYNGSASRVLDRLLNQADRDVGAGPAWGRRLNAAAAVGGRVNRAVGKPATQSSTFAGAAAARAVDGNPSGLWSIGSVTHTNADAQAWWQVDLQTTRYVERIDVWNRTDCCGERLANFVVETSTNGTSWTLARAVTGQAGLPTMVVLGRNARYVRVKLTGTNYLALAEVEVWSR